MGISSDRGLFDSRIVQLTIELLTRAENQAKYNRWDLKERKKAREEAMGRAENDGDARDYEEDITASFADTTGINETNVIDANANETNATDVSSKAKAKVVTMARMSCPAL
ncbi:hypothetical protein LCI18_007807 [Fusarium solani-melongenae]|uniref:Uncharacterized protein n=1 Tax=Fusarium solani subsp. cucurbitae TaxID=2747967 RepID=A0ACD3Z6P2_FUSSC|nr:hypothetical protein LCI18_007807 [Fusarium solani-melongenae]